MHFMHAAQMIFLLNVYMLIIRFTFYSLTLLSIEFMINQYFNFRIFIMTTHDNQLKLLLTNKYLFMLRNHAEQRVFVLFSNASTSAQEIENV